jgi:hypothetical protein
MIVGEAWSWPKRASQGADQEPGPGLFKSEPRGLMFAAECVIILDDKLSSRSTGDETIRNWKVSRSRLKCSAVAL